MHEGPRAIKEASSRNGEAVPIMEPTRAPSIIIFALDLNPTLCSVSPSMNLAL